jgi:hypothetical protein
LPSCATSKAERRHDRYAFFSRPDRGRRRRGAGAAGRDGSSGSNINLTYTEHYGLQRPKVTAQVTAAGLDLTAKCPNGLLSSNCSVNYTLSVPVGVHLKLDTGDGSVSLEGIDGPVDVHSGDGSIRGIDLRSTQVTADSGDGTVSLAWAVAPDRVDLSTGDGSVNLSVPNDSGPYAIDKDTGDGSSDITVKQDPKATQTMRLRTGDGNISVH